MRVIFKICSQDDWTAAEQAGIYTGSPLDAQDGFIHFSQSAQVAGTLAKYYAGVDGLVLVAIDETGLDIKWEPARDGQLFPHLYSPLALTHVRWVKPLLRGDDGAFVLAGLLPD
jgi:uncharacterized protein (DUF952 family)